jgi:hypothetical protein
MNAVAANRLEYSAGIGHAVEDVLTAAWKRRTAETERLLDLDRRRKLTALRIVPGAAHFFEEEAAEIRDGGAALAGGNKEGRGSGLRVPDAELILLVQLFFEGELRCIVGGLGERVGDLLLDFRSTDGRLRHGARRNGNGDDAGDSQQDSGGASTNFLDHH